MQTAEPDPVLHLDLPVHGGVAARTVAGRRLPALPLAIAVVVVLAGGGAVHVRLLDGPPGRDAAGHAGVRRARPSSRSGTRTTRSTSATPAARSTASALDPGRDPRHDRVARRPVLLLPDVGRVPPEPAGDQRPVRGDRRRDRDAGAPTGRRAARRSGRTAVLVIVDAARRARRPRRPACVAGDLVLAADGVALDGLTVDERPRPDPRPEGHRWST